MAFLKRGRGDLAPLLGTWSPLLSDMPDCNWFPYILAKKSALNIEVPCIRYNVFPHHGVAKKRLPAEATYFSS